MEVYVFRRFGIRYKQIWFNKEEQSSAIHHLNADIIEYKESYNELEGLYPFSNGVINLNLGLNTIYDNLEKGFKYEVRRAEKENFNCCLFDLVNEDELKKIFDCYKVFSIRKNIPFIDYRFLNRYFNNQSLKITVVKLDEKVLQYHLYYLSKEELILLASFPTAQSSSLKKSSLGFANRYLHWFDIQLAVQLHKQVYNLGGMGNTNEARILSIANFKKEMSPESKIYYNGLVPITLKGKFFFILKKKMIKYANSIKNYID